MEQVEVRILGPVRIAGADGVNPVSSPRARTVLAALALRHDQVVSVDELVEAAWGGKAPRTAANQVQIAIFRLRQAFVGAGADAHAAIVTHPNGYQLAGSVVGTDVLTFRQLVRSAEQAAGLGDWAVSARHFEDALQIWQGHACQDVDSAHLAEAVSGLAEDRRDAAERLAAVEVLLDRPVAGHIAALLADDPLRERLWYLLILGHARSGRQAQALEEYHRARRTLVRELGLEPGSALRDLEQRVLHGRLDEASEVVRRWLRGPVAETPTGVWQVPADIPDFTGRTAEVDRISALLRAEDDHPAVVCLAGLGGMGKTTLAVRVARGLQSRFPDGCVFFDLRGTDSHPPEATDVTAAVLRALGVPGEAIPAEAEERTGRLRAELTSRRLLLVMDNARDEGQVRSLIPPTGGSALFVTGRRLLAGIDGAHLLDLDVLPENDALRLLGRLAGATRIEAEATDAARLVRLCGGLPLAVRIAGVRLARRPSTPISRLAARLADEQSRLDELAFGDREVRAAFSVSHGRLDPVAGVLLRRLGLLPVPETPSWVAASLLDLPLPAAERVAQALVSASLLNERDDEDGIRYRLHDLVRLYAREQSDDEDGQVLRQAYDLIAAEALRVGVQLPVRSFPHDAPPDQQESPSVPLAWLERNEALFLGVAQDAADRGWWEVAVRTLTAMTDYVSLRGASEWPAAAARVLSAIPPDEPVRTDLLLAMGMLAQTHGRYDDALPLLRQARRRYLAQGDPARAAVAAGQYGIVLRRRGQWRAVPVINAWATARLPAHQYPAQLARILLSQGNYHFETFGDSAVGQADLERALGLAYAGGDLEGAGNILGISGLFLRRDGRLTEARVRFEEAAELAATIGSNTGAAILRAYLVRVLADLGELDAGAVAAELSVRAALEGQHPRALREAYSSSGQIALARGDYELAEEHLVLAVELSRSSGVLGLGGALFLLAKTRLAQGAEKDAQLHAAEARGIYASLGRPEADLIDAWLASWQSTAGR
ncbi:DNA-binding SARP family transcriptional activator/tetratricopeptide (TPR) repeat protein [Hamadaea flava]|uniref:BTAD domain-containing putative transcriptional regulator n=1 Tax=Hamadaea flava TaxID=1742688 RepID=A0ABV8LUT0_9ACTN|nr:AfsR/SARP family transcriptional regulator [Hamadaea flava]MCP2327667.1 DNA-binding SARP family transcriptional activator/tetratricopeptide (TPR) repeat protein [Hamadaea flava]